MRPRDTRSLEALIDAALAEEINDSETCPALVELHERGTRDVLDAALNLCSSPDRIRRLVGARILGELGSPRSFPEECCDALLKLVHDDKDEEVMALAVNRLGHLGNRRCEPDLIALRQHPNPHVRHAVAFSLTGSTTQAALEVQLELMEDSYYMARDWATTSVGQTLSFDSAHIREALLRRAMDEDVFVRAEALHGLARRGDARAAPFLLETIKSQIEAVHLFEDAARELIGKDAENSTTEELIAILEDMK